MDILKPSLVWVQGRCYRKNQEAEYKVERGYTGEEDDELNGDAEDAHSQEIHHFQHKLNEFGGGYRVSLQISSHFFPQLIGTGGKSKLRLEKETSTQIVIPKRGVEGDIVVQGKTSSGVVRCANRIDAMVLACRQKQPFTHFVSLPINSTSMQKAFHQFKQDVLEECEGIQGIDETIFQTSTLLHLTVATMVLTDDRERQLARELLEKCNEEIIMPLQNGQPFEVDIVGLEIMNDDPSVVDVLYAKVVNCDKLQQAAEKIIDKFVFAGLMKREYEKVKLHATLMNTLFRKEDTDINDIQTTAQQRESFDSRLILDMYGDRPFQFGVEISEIHLSQRRAGRRTAEGYYLPSAILKIGHPTTARDCDEVGGV